MARDARCIGAWSECLDGAAALVNFVGRSVDCIKTPDHRDEILRSRVEATRVLGATSRAVARAWEEAFEEARLAHMRTVVLRTSFVVGMGGGAMKRLALLVRLGLGGTITSGRQGMSWIHLHDMNRLFERAIADESMRGMYIASSPNPMSNREFMTSLRRALRMPLGLPAFAWMVRLSAPLLLPTDPELALYGRYCIPRRLIDDGFKFNFPRIDEALADLLSAGATRE